MKDERVEKILAALKQEGMQSLKDDGRLSPGYEPIYPHVNEIVASEIRYFFYEVFTDTDVFDDELLEGFIRCMCMSYYRACANAIELHEVTCRMEEAMKP